MWKLAFFPQDVCVIWQITTAKGFKIKGKTTLKSESTLCLQFMKRPTMQLFLKRTVYPKEDLDGLGAGGSCGSTWHILSNHSEGSIGLSTTTVVLRKDTHT